MLAHTISPRRHHESLRQGFPFVHTLKGDKVIVLEALYELEIIAHIVIRQRCRLVVDQRSGHTEAHIVPVEICLQGVVDKCRFLVELVYKLSRERMRA